MFGTWPMCCPGKGACGRENFLHRPSSIALSFNHKTSKQLTTKQLTTNHAELAAPTPRRSKTIRPRPLSSKPECSKTEKISQIDQCHHPENTYRPRKLSGDFSCTQHRMSADENNFGRQSSFQYACQNCPEMTNSKTKFQKACAWLYAYKRSDRRREEDRTKLNPETPCNPALISGPLYDNICLSGLTPRQYSGISFMCNYRGLTALFSWNPICANIECNGSLPKSLSTYAMSTYEHEIGR